MNRHQLVILAAGMGSRFGGLKQIAPMGVQGDWLLSFSLWDAWKSGIRRLVFVIRHEIFHDFNQLLLNRLVDYFEVRVVFQKSEHLPPDLEGRIPRRAKPWGTAHALWCAKEAIDGPFIVINADDYYGRNAFEQVLASMKVHGNCMLGYPLHLTTSAHGGVSRGICDIDPRGYLHHIEEAHKINLKADDVFCDDLGRIIDPQTLVSMNIWGLEQDWLPIIEKYMVQTFLSAGESAIETLECYLPAGICSGLGQVPLFVERAGDHWLGVTYQKDHDPVASSLQKMQYEGAYPLNFWQSNFKEERKK